MSPSARRFRDVFLIGGLLLLILGIRIFIGIRFVALIPQADDWFTLHWLQNWSDGIRDWRHVWQRDNNHPMSMYFLMEIVQYRLNGYWDARLDFLASAVIHTAYAAAVILIFRNILAPKDRGWLLGLIFFLFAIPFAGFRINWGIIWPHSTMMLFSLWALYGAAFYRESWAGIGVTILLACLAALNMADGCLAALMVAVITLFRAALIRRITIREVVLSIACLSLFLGFYLTMTFQGTATHASFLEVYNSFMKALAWPVVFTSPAGILTLVPLAGLGLTYLGSPSFRTRSVEFLLGVGSLLFLVALATGLLRGDTQGQGTPSGRYTEIFVMVPLFCATALVLLYRGSAGRQRWAWGVFAWIWICAQVLGFSIHIFYRTLPFIAHENGEWNDANMQVTFREMSRGVQHTYFPHSDPLSDGTLDSLVPVEMLKGQVPLPAMTLPMMTGFPLWPGSQGNYVQGGYHPAYQPRPTQLYVGSFDIDHRSPDGKWFLSGPFRPVADYITMDILVDKNARLSNYQLSGLQIILRDETTGVRTELLPKLAHTYPFVFRDWEVIYERVRPGDQYRIESYTTGLRNWIAFGEPFESGRLTPFTVGATQSGKLLCICGLGLLMLALGMNFLFEKESRPG